MTILYPEVFWIFLPLLLLLFFAFIQYRKGRRLLLRLAGSWRQEKSEPVYLLKTIVYWLTMFLFFSFSLLALSGISWEKQPVKDESKGTDILFVVDVSRSMLARDLNPDRLGHAAELINTLISQGKDNRNGIIIFKGDAQVLVPLTDDHIALESGVNSLSSNLYTAPGTNMARGIEVALQAFPEGSPARKMIVLISDGESLEGNPLQMARECYLQEVSLFIVGCGSSEGSLLYDGAGELIRDAQGQAVISRLDALLLQDMASRSSGLYYDLSEAGTSSMILEDIHSLSEKSGSEGIRYKDRFSYRFFLILALFFLVVNLFTMQLRWSRWY